MGSGTLLQSCGIVDMGGLSLQIVPHLIIPALLWSIFLQSTKQKKLE